MSTFTSYVKEKILPFLAGMSSAVIMIIAFFIPSIQDQFDRYESRKIVNEYEKLGNAFYTEDRYDMAEQAYQKAFELSDSRRLDLEVKRLTARINRINLDPTWGAKAPEDLEAIDFQYVLHMQAGPGQKQDRLSTLNSYGIFLAAGKKFAEAEEQFTTALVLDSTYAVTFINLGNLYDQQGRKAEALGAYKKAIALEPANSRAHYNLGLLYKDLGKDEDALAEFKNALRSDSADSDILNQIRMMNKDSLNK